VIAAGKEDFIAAGEEHIFRIGIRGSKPKQIASLPNGAGRVTSIADDGRTLWITTAKDTIAELISLPLYQQQETTRGAAARVHLAGSARVVSIDPGLAMVSLINPPHSIFLFDAAGSALTSATLPVQLAAEPTAPGRHSIVTIAAVPLDCGRVLQILSDLRSDRRWLALYHVNPRTIEFIRIRSINMPIGIVQSLPEERLLVGVENQFGRSEIVLFSWSWS
jgi:hypothetical protein